MRSRGLIGKTVREIWVTTLLCSAGLFAFEILLAYVLQTFRDDIVGKASGLLQTELFQNILRSLLGSSIGAQFGPDTFNAIAWVHPVVLALLWAFEITICTRVPAGEVDRGSIDVLLGLPVSRWRVYVCEAAVWASAGVLVITCALIGNRFGNYLAGTEQPPGLARMLIIAVNLFTLYGAVGGMTFLISSVSDRRGRAVAVAFGIVLASFLLNFLAQFWSPAEKVSFLGMLNYYRPLLVVRDAAWPTGDIMVLAAVGLVLWLTGGVLFARRDICTV